MYEREREREGASERERKKASERERKKASEERERKRASENEIEIECAREKTTSSNACVTPPSANPVPHAHIYNPGAHNMCSVHVWDTLPSTSPVPHAPVGTPARTPGAARTTEAPVPHAHVNPK